jgi:hypothetical protein
VVQHFDRVLLPAASVVSSNRPMAKKKAGNTTSGGATAGKAAAKAAKKAKAAAKVERKEVKKVKSGRAKGGPEDEDDQGLEDILERVSILIGDLSPPHWPCTSRSDCLAGSRCGVNGKRRTK